MSLTFPFASRLARNLARANVRQDWRNLPEPMFEEIDGICEIDDGMDGEIIADDDTIDEIVFVGNDRNIEPINVGMVLSEQNGDHGMVRRCRMARVNRTHVDNSRHQHGHRQRHSDQFEAELAELDNEMEVAWELGDSFNDWEPMPEMVDDPEIAEFVEQLEQQAA